MSNLKSKRGGVRLGAGAPFKAELTKNRTICLLDADWLKFKAKGGTAWLKELLKD